MTARFFIDGQELTTEVVSWIPKYSDYSNTYSLAIKPPGALDRFATTEELIEITINTMEALETNGWSKGRLQRYEGNLCLMGGLSAGAKHKYITDAVEDMTPQQREWVYQFVTQMLQAVPASLRQAVNMIESWNDDSQRTYEDVRNKLDDFLRELKGR